MKRKILFFCCIVLVLNINQCRAKKSWELNLKYTPGYESNVFHATPDSTTHSDLVNYLSFDALYRYRPRYNLIFRLKPQLEYELYSEHGQRDKSGFGSALQMDWRLPAKFRFRAEADVSRRVKDLVGDSGEELPRTLKKWVFAVGSSVRRMTGNLTTEITYLREFDNYDESTDERGNRLRSYDYDQHEIGLRIKQKINRLLVLKFDYTAEFRDYKERVTRSIKKIKGTYKWELREHTRHTFALSSFLEWGKFAWEAEYEFSDKKDSYQNYYGYQHHQTSFYLRYVYLPRARIWAKYRYKTKDYPNYSTERIGILRTVSVKYHDFYVRFSQPLSSHTNLTGQYRYYRKKSNDPKFAYANITLQVGIELNW